MTKLKEFTIDEMNSITSYTDRIEAKKRWYEYLKRERENDKKELAKREKKIDYFINSDYYKLYRLNNKDKQKISQKKYTDKNREKINAYMKEYARKNRKKLNLYKVEYRKTKRLIQNKKE